MAKNITGLDDSLRRYWQLRFNIEGLVAPKEGLCVDDVLFLKGEEGTDRSAAYFGAWVENESEKDQRFKDAEKYLGDFLRFSSLFTGRPAKIVGISAAGFPTEQPLGSPMPTIEVVAKQIFGKENTERFIKHLNHAAEKFSSLKKIFDDKRKAYLKNAIDYFYIALDEPRLEEGLIDLFISLESLFSRDVLELRFRVSLRAASLLGVMREDERPNIFEQIYGLYDKRSKVVHGLEVDLSRAEISALEDFVRESIMYLSYFEMTKDDILSLLDKSLYDNAARKALLEIVQEVSK